MSNPTWTISIAVHNCMEATRTCLDSIAAHCGAENIEIIVTDNASTDGTRYFLDEWGREHPRISTIGLRLVTNDGFGAAHNLALGMAHGEYFLVLNNDVEILAPTFLPILRSGFLGPNVRLVGASGTFQSLTEAGVGRTGGPVEYLDGACLCGRTEFLRSLVTMFHPAYEFSFCEDADLSLRVRLAGYSILPLHLPMKHVGGLTRATLTTPAEADRLHNAYERNHETFRKTWSRYLASEDRLFPAEQGNVTVVVPVRWGGNPAETLRSLDHQTISELNIRVYPDQGRGSNWARNRGFELVRTPYVLFSDDDIDWEPDAIQVLYETLLAHPEASYSYGHYTINGDTFCDRQFDPDALRRWNYISTMSLIRTADFPGFDEQIQRLQDWALWLEMLRRGKTGVYCGQKIFSTRRRPEGITYGTISEQDAREAVRRKHSL